MSPALSTRLGEDFNPLIPIFTRALFYRGRSNFSNFFNDNLGFQLKLPAPVDVDKWWVVDCHRNPLRIEADVLPFYERPKVAYRVLLGLNQI